MYNVIGEHYLEYPAAFVGTHDQNIMLEVTRTMTLVRLSYRG